ncbi:MAG: ATP-binding cassette domain-containing protein, partial [Bacteroides sp.]
LNQQIEAEESTLRLARKKARETKERQEKRINRGAKSVDGMPRIILKGKQDKGEETAAKLSKTHTSITHTSQHSLADLRRKQNIKCDLKLNFDNSRIQHGKRLVTAQGINFKYEQEKFLWHTPLDIEIRSGERIHLRGNNGTGKTTLLNLLVGELQPSTGTIQRAAFSFVYLDQEYSKVSTPQTLLELVQEYNHQNLLDHEIKLRLHRTLFPKEVWDKPCNELSGGERMRIYLCCLMISNHIPDLFILDEPTNNLDLSSLAILTNTMKDYQGTLLVISHDKHFIDQINISKIIELENP